MREWDSAKIEEHRRWAPSIIYSTQSPTAKLWENQALPHDWPARCSQPGLPVVVAEASFRWCFSELERYIQKSHENYQDSLYSLRLPVMSKMIPLWLPVQHNRFMKTIWKHNYRMSEENSPPSGSVQQLFLKLRQVSCWSSEEALMWNPIG